MMKFLFSAHLQGLLSHVHYSIIRKIDILLVNIQETNVFDAQKTLNDLQI